MPAGNQRLRLAPTHRLFQQGGRLTVVTAGKLDHTLVDPVGLQAIPAAEAGAANARRGRLGHGVDPLSRHLEHPGVAPVDDGHVVGGAPLQGHEQGPHMWPGRDNRSFRRRARQRDCIGQPQLAADEDRGRVAQPAAGMLLQQNPHFPPVSVTYPDRAGAVPGPACRRREELACPGRQAAQRRRAHRHLHIERQHRWIGRPCAQQLVNFRVADHRPPPRHEPGRPVRHWACQTAVAGIRPLHHVSRPYAVPCRGWDRNCQRPSTT